MPAKKFFVSKEQLEMDYRELSSMIKIARKYGVSKKLILNYMNEFGIERKMHRAKDTDARVKPLLESGMKTSEIATRLKLSQATVGNSAKRLDMPLNNYYHNGEIITHNGYRMVKAPEGHPGAAANGYIREHRLVMEEKIGRVLESGEIVHHINEDKMDNRESNLALMAVADHNSLHHTGKIGRGPDKKPRKNAAKI